MTTPSADERGDQDRREDARGRPPSGARLHSQPLTASLEQNGWAKKKGFFGPLFEG
ncbi:MAG: hypothetical protein K0S70_4929 [Microbacterium sp.]|jgi:hypothetical protein|uniref:hypothetical protein n=1 Tax=Microbacterium sp. Kw_RZR3 TaxID=3032903 RepID=UPI0023DB3ABF|nr:hypothetical protein [Microbacterium sp. Kw_RZR3]MDF2045403.1 hypothetical protein [Microbacterium sp. Kw_RZR3]MDF2920711.1 hypothetical protein [Microbacterium sp.]